MVSRRFSAHLDRAAQEKLASRRHLRSSRSFVPGVPIGPVGVSMRNFLQHGISYRLVP